MAPSVFIICRGSPTEGFGHVVRSSEVARALHRMDVDATLCLVGDETAASIISRTGIEYNTYASDDDAAAEIGKTSADICVIDALSLGDEAFDNVRSVPMVASLSPVFNQQSGVDVLFSRAYPPSAERIERVRLRCGLDYAVIGRDVQRIETRRYAEHLDAGQLAVGISMGGADALNITREVLAALNRVTAPLLIWAVLGEGYGHSYDDLVDTVKSSQEHGVALIRAPSAMWTILSRVSLLISSGGLTTYEAAHAGIPTVNIMADPARGYLIEELVRRGASNAVYLGHQDWVDDLCHLVTRAATDRDSLLLSHRIARRLVDGRGAQRIARGLVDFWDDSKASLAERKDNPQHLVSERELPFR